MKGTATSPNRPEEREDPETVRVIEERLKTAQNEPKRGDEALREIQSRRKLKHPPNH
jgi:hypothetical protein